LSKLKSASETTLRLNELNLSDILSYVSDATEQCDELHNSDLFIREICSRADGVFLWVVCAVQDIVRWADTKEQPALLERLDE
jgi:hypothetical protein